MSVFLGVLSHQPGLADCIQYMHGQFCSERDLVKGMRHKHVVGHNGLHGALYYHWKLDTGIFALELDRVERAAGSLPRGSSSQYSPELDLVQSSRAAARELPERIPLYSKDVKLRLAAAGRSITAGPESHHHAVQGQSKRDAP